MSLQCGSMEKEGFLFLHKTKDKCILMTSPFKKYYVTLSKDTLSYSRTQHSKVSDAKHLLDLISSVALIFSILWKNSVTFYDAEELVHLPAQDPGCGEGGGEVLRQCQRHADYF